MGVVLAVTRLSGPQESTIYYWRVLKFGHRFVYLKSYKVKQSILIVLPWSPELPGGVSVVVRNLAKTWLDESIPSTILVNDWNTINIKEVGCQTFQLRLSVISKFIFRNILKLIITALPILIRTWSFLRARKITTVYFHYPSLDALGILILKRVNIYRGSVILCFHGTDVRRPINRIETILWRFVFASADAVTACSNALAREIERNFALATGQVLTIYNGVDTATFAPSAAARDAWIGFPIVGKPYIVSVGSFIERKGHRFLLDAFAHLAPKYPDLYLVIIGMDGPERIPLEAMVAQLQLENRVLFLIGLPPEQVAYIVARAMVCVQPSIAEPFGMAVIEAGACGVLVAASNVGGHAELIESGVTGLLFPASNSHAIACVLEKLFCGWSLQHAIVLKFREQILVQYTWKACADAYIAAGNR